MSLVRVRIGQQSEGNVGAGERKDGKRSPANAFRAAYIFRPSVMPPMHGARSKTDSYRLFYTLSKPLLPLMHRLFPNYVLTTEEIGQAMLGLARHGFTKTVLNSWGILAAFDNPQLH